VKFTSVHINDHPGVADALWLHWSYLLGRAMGMEYVHSPLSCERSGHRVDEFLGLGRWGDDAGGTLPERLTAVDVYLHEHFRDHRPSSEATACVG
jgi:hypothetical protein